LRRSEHIGSFGRKSTKGAKAKDVTDFMSRRSSKEFREVSFTDFGGGVLVEREDVTSRDWGLGDTEDYHCEQGEKD